MRGIRLATVVSVVIGATVAIHADVKTQQKGQVTLGGALGRMFSMFGGRAAREGVVTRVAVKGDRMMTVSDESGQLIDLAEEKVYRHRFRRQQLQGHDLRRAAAPDARGRGEGPAEPGEGRGAPGEGRREARREAAGMRD